MTNTPEQAAATVDSVMALADEHGALRWETGCEEGARDVKHAKHADRAAVKARAALEAEVRRLAAQQAPKLPALPKERIRQGLLAHELEDEPGYQRAFRAGYFEAGVQLEDAGESVAAAPVVRLPLTEEQIMGAFQAAFPGHELHAESVAFARAVERAHGIGTEPASPAEPQAAALPLRMLTRQELFTGQPAPAMSAESIQRKFCEVNGLTLAAPHGAAEKGDAS